MRRLYCPTSCGSLTFRVIRRGVLVQDVSIDEETGEMIMGEALAEAGGFASVSCECGHYWKTKSQAVEGIAEFMEVR